MKKKILILDICGTIYDSNTTFDFLDYYFSLKKNNKYRILLILKKIYFIRKLNGIIYKLFNKDFLRIYGTSLLKNSEVEEVRKKTEIFCKEILENKKKKKIIEIIEKLKKNNYTIIIVSGTYDFIASAIADTLKIEFFYGSVLAKRDGYYLGKIEKDILLKKEEIVRKKKEENKESELYLLTDNITDSNLLSYMKYSYIVINPKNKKFWNKYIKKSKYRERIEAIE